MRPEREAIASPAKASCTVDAADGKAIGIARAPVNDAIPTSVATAAAATKLRGLIKISMLPRLI